MAHESWEERTSNHRLSKRAKFWIGILVFLITVTGFSLKDFWPNSPEVAAPSPTSTIPTPVSTGGGWGPPRATFKIDQPATYAVLNSITDNPDYGDERQFFTVRPADVTKFGPNFKTSLRVTAGDVLTFRVLYEDSAADNFEDSDPSWIQGATAVLAYDDSPLLRRVMQLSISAANSPMIWSALVLESENLFSLEYVRDSARIYNNAHGLKTAKGPYKFDFDQLRSATGLKLGYDEMNGTIRPGYQYAGYIYFDMKVVDAS
ncbi:hypothetical protein IV500_17115 [Paeniglutamicibacter antarcticus]|uniref:Uncharacterized protein n=1 Tax=Arthrobacter terrae TaxID=2935737 RepID=A0A931CRI5_9MICC|nr:hypothetical protein [Arthrobacter terrae]MBG0741095.1 hypothetical protein [Arthrobacter terrae]